MEQIICRFGAPRIFLSDKGSNFHSTLISDILSLLGIKRRSTTAYHPQCDGLTERFNRTLLERIAFYVNHYHDDWDLHLPYCLFAYRSAQQASTGYSPHFLLFHREPYLPSDVMLRPTEQQKSSSDIMQKIDATFRQAQHNILQAQKRQKRNYDKKRKAHNYQEEELIWLYNPVVRPHESKKFVFHWLGPYRILKIYDNDTLDIQPVHGSGPNQRVHAARTKHCYDSQNHPTSRQYEYEDPKLHDEFEIDEIMDRTEINGETHYWVHFKGFSKRYNQWIPLSDLKAEELINRFERQQLLSQDNEDIVKSKERHM